ncbi:hypothetical protein BH23THE1_BH23THE1_22570 [soil metagenome]
MISRRFLQLLLVTIFLIGLSLNFYVEGNSFHRPYHDGPSCDGCHCSSNQECSYDPDEGCSCTTPILEIK